MIEIVKTGKCKDCKLAELEVYSFFCGNEKEEQFIECKHKKVCDMMEERFKEKNCIEIAQDFVQL